MAGPALLARATRVVRRQRARLARRPPLSIVVAAGPEAAAGLPETLASIEPVTTPAEVLVVHADDWRTAANQGVARSTGRWVFVVPGGDLVVAAGLDAGLDRLLATAADAFWAPTRRRGRPDPWAVSPPALPDPAVGSVVARRHLWPGFDAGDLDELSPALVRAATGSHRVVRGSTPLTEARPGGGRRAFGASPSRLPDLDVRAAAIREIGDLLDDTPWQEAWSRRVANVLVPQLLDETERATPDQWRALRDLAARVPDTDAVALPRALLALARDDRSEDLAVLAEHAWLDGHDLRTEIVDGELLAVWPVDLPVGARRVTETESRLVAAVHRRDVASVEAVVRVPHLDLAAHRPRVSVRGLLVDALPHPAAHRWAGHRFAGAVVVSLPVTPVATELPLRLEVEGLVRETTLAIAAVPTRTRAVVTGLALAGPDLVVEHPPRHRLHLVADDTALPAPRRHHGSTRWSLAAAPPGVHRLIDGDSPAASVPGLLPVDQIGLWHRLAAVRGPHGGFVVRLQAPLDDDELGPHAQQRLQDAYLADDRPLDEGLWLFETYAGRSATDNPLAIFEELRRRDQELRAMWSVSDHAQWTPDGVTPVLRHSREWYAALAAADTLVVNTDMDECFRLRPGQFLLQCFHGYPSKAMGRDQWAALALLPREVRMARRRGVDTWSAILTPTPAMTEHYRKQYDYGGPALEQGYPRDDALTSESSGEARQRSRAELGIGDRVAVLYAPTWREHLATRPRAADLTDHLDPARLADLLGEDHVVLLRGHRFHRTRSQHPRVLDVTDHREVNDLVLASDAAVLDYSSLRFDYALTRKPMVFLVPDLAHYSAGTRAFLMPFEETAPGPFVQDTDEVAARLRDLGRLRAEWAEEVEAFVAAYHPWQDGRATVRVVDELLSLRSGRSGR